MKKIFFIIGIATFSVASAQQNDFLDVQKLIHKKNQEKQKMNIDSLCVRSKNRCWESTNLPYSQRGVKITQDKVKADLLKKLSDAYSYRFPHTFQSPSPLGTLSHVLPNSNKVYSLPQDNMPCVVPGMTEFNMPVVKAEVIPYAIPNPAYPPQSKTAPLPFERLKELLEKQKEAK